MWFKNLHRIRELDQEKLRIVAQEILRWKDPQVLQALCFFWGAVLVMSFTLVFAVRLALTIPLF